MFSRPEGFRDIHVLLSYGVGNVIEVWSFGLWVSANKDTALRAQVLAVVFAHFILSGILALEANMLM